MATDAHWLDPHALRSARPARVRSRSRSMFVTMRDGTRIAIDVYVPRAKTRLPTIVRQTRYLRSLEARPPFGALGVPSRFDLYAATRRTFLANGYAWVDVDVRGTGASGGSWSSPWFEDEVKDGAEIVDWIIRQPWSSGVVGSLGISYDGTAAEMLLANGHPAVRAVAPLFALYDVYSDVAFPGGVHLAWFTDAWSRYNAALDRGAFPDAACIPIQLMLRAAAGVPEPRGASRVAAAVGRANESAVRVAVAALIRGVVRGGRAVEGKRADDARARAKNLDVHAGALRMTFRDDTGIHPEHHDKTVDDFSPHKFRADIAARSKAAIYSYSGWRDGAYPHSAIKRHLTVPTNGGRLTLGPWAHTGKLRIHAFGLGAPTEFDHDAELLDFFDVHLKGARSRGDGAPVHYFTLGEEKWKSSSSWPPPDVRPRVFHLGEARSLGGAAPTDGSDDHAIDARLGTGARSRWRSLLSLVPGDYPNRREADARALAYDSAPLDRDMEATGHPMVVLHVAWHGTGDGRVFAYLEDVAPDGRVSYVTEGQLRALHRKTSDARAWQSPAPYRSFTRADASPVGDAEIAELEIDLLPVSYLFRKGHRVRLVLAGADADHFAPPSDERATMRVHRGARRPSRLVLQAKDA
jgi:putative CocE/NonD family hydrolase